ncbi:MAG: zinc dependent phospholipase C family protein [Syntrophobacteraceae bacterium]|nr:zinc dependent phospholipase C family protein [Desulfobacteraceae bacterium]
MPKERLHMLLADESLRMLEAAGRLPASCGELRFACLLGAVSPDMLFYDMPTFRLSGIGSALHRLQGEAGAAFFREWLMEEGDRLPADVRAWMLGMAGHLLSDGYWHPAIDSIVALPGGPCRLLGLSRGPCHHWVESELEACWVGRVGEPDGYFAILARFRKERELTAKYAAWFMRFLERAGAGVVPDIRRILRCLDRQALLLAQFAEPGWARWRPVLLKGRRTQHLGALLVPGTPRLPSCMAGGPEGPENEKLCDGAFLARAVFSLTERLAGLPVRL